ncbi:MAG: rRNA pseudouridine synthase, partial [Eubacterium sp.]|nr:rRNA pseudouridine synthase [Eubacterium sp.]
MEQIRLNKYLAQCGVCSRREADKLIEQGRVKVNGQIAVAGQQVSEADEIQVNKKILQGRAEKKVLAFYKPIGVTCTEKDRHAERIITDMIDYPIRVTYAGRLDRDSEGLLLLTNDGDLIDAMMRGANRHEKEYVVRVDKEITDVFLEKMASGIFLKELEL